MTDRVSGIFEAATTSVAGARHLVHGLESVLPSDAVERLRLVVGELAANAVEHARTPYEVCIQVDPLRVEVTDHSHQLPVLRRPGLTDPSGRGLFIVSAYSHEWGYDLRPDGKTVWALVQR